MGWMKHLDSNHTLTVMMEVVQQVFRQEAGSPSLPNCLVFPSASEELLVRCLLSSYKQKACSRGSVLRAV